MNANQDMNRDSFILYKSFYDPISGLTDEEMGRLFRAIFQWQINGKADQDPGGVVGMAFGFITNQFRIDNGKYLERCEKNRTNANIRWEKTKNATASNRIQSHPNECEKCEPMRMMPNENENENGNENENENGTLFGGPGDDTPARKNRKVFARPSIGDVAAYCEERGNGIDPAAFMDYYDSVGWKVGNKSMRDWRAAVRTWERTRTAKANDQVIQTTGKIITDIDDLYKD